MDPLRYTPCRAEILYSYRKTTGFKTQKYFKMTILDVGGQRNERKKWNSKLNQTNNSYYGRK